MNDVDTNKIIVSIKVPFGQKGFKYFIGYEDNEKVPKMCGYQKNIEETKYMSFLVKDDELPEKYNKI